MDLHPCSCGTADFGANHKLRPGGGALVAVYAGTCRGCGLPRLFEFVLAPRTPPPPPAFGGDEPSQIICPGQFALLADREARAASTTDAVRRRAALDLAVAAHAEVAKFVPAGAGAVPAAAFTSRAGAALYAADPGRFDADRLAVVADAYRRALAGHGPS
jgi:hypothetical protein